MTAVLLPGECVVSEDEPDRSPAKDGPVVLEEDGTVGDHGEAEIIRVTYGDAIVRYRVEAFEGYIDRTGDHGGRLPASMVRE